MKAGILTIFGLSVLLAACGDKNETNAVTTSEAADNMAAVTGNMSSGMGNMAMAAGTKMAKGSGTVTEIDRSAGTVTLDHGPIPDANWPAMTMAFKAKPELLDGVKVGDKVAFELALKDGAGEVTAIKRR